MRIENSTHNLQHVTSNRIGHTYIQLAKSIRYEGERLVESPSDSPEPEWVPGGGRKRKRNRGSTSSRGYNDPRWQNQDFASGDRRAYANDGKSYGQNNGKGYGKSFGKNDGKGYGKNDGKSYGKNDGKGYGKPHGKGYGKNDGKGYGNHYGNSYGKNDGKGYGKGDGKSDTTDTKGTHTLIYGSMWTICKNVSIVTLKITHTNFGVVHSNMCTCVAMNPIIWCNHMMQWLKSLHIGVRSAYTICDYYSSSCTSVSTEHSWWGGRASSASASSAARQSLARPEYRLLHKATTYANLVQDTTTVGIDYPVP